MKNSTAVPQNFVIFSCDNYSVAGSFVCSTADELAAWLSSQADFLDLPTSLYWGRLSRRVFRGRVVFLAGYRSGHLLIRSEGVLSFKQSGGRLVQCDTDSWTLLDHEEATSTEEARVRL